MLQQQQLSRHRNNISNLHSAFDISSRRSKQTIYINVRERRPLQPRRAGCSAARPHHFVGATPTILLRAERFRSAAAAAPRITLRYYAYETTPRRARSHRGTPHHVATPTILRSAERVCSAASRITLQLLCLRYSATLSAFASRHPRITLRLLRLPNPAAPSAFARKSPHHFAVTMPTTLRRAADAALLPGRMMGPDLVSSSTPSYPHP